MRLLSFLTEIERAIAADDPSPLGGSWENTRTVNYHEGLARLTLVARVGNRTQNLGAVLLQGFVLADGSRCLKAFLSWQQGGAPFVHAVYEKPDLDWSSQARSIASNWLNVFAEAADSLEAQSRSGHVLAAVAG